jgi:beta-phosphoglucomutase family hydrolase
MKRAVLWDLDGTLVDSEEYHWQAWRDAMAAEGVAITRQQFLRTFGLRNDVVVPMLLGAGGPPERIERIGREKEDDYRRLVRTSGLDPLPGAAEWVRRLHQEGWLQAIGSSAPRLNIQVVMEAIGLGSYFEAISSAEDVTAGKPDPQVFLVAAARLGVDPSRCIVVEDAAGGVEAARRAGMRSIGIGHAGKPLGADVSVPSLTALAPDIFTKLLA